MSSSRLLPAAVLLVSLLPASAAGHTFRADRLPIGPPQAPAAHAGVRPGTMSVRIDTEANRLRLDIDAEPSGPAGHAVRILGPARREGDDGLRATLPGAHATWTYPESDEADLLAGRLYVDVESAASRVALRGRIEHLAIDDGGGDSTTVLTLVALGFAALGAVVVVTQRKPVAAA